ncbi:hypothetical protein [Roseateles sp. P5_E7]
MISPYVLLAAGGAWLASLAAAAHLAYGAGLDAETAAQAREDKAAAVAADAAASAIAAAIPKITVRHQTVRQELEREIQTREVYRNPDCDTGPDSLQRFNAAIGATAAAIPRSGAVPASDAGH